MWAHVSLISNICEKVYWFLTAKVRLLCNVFFHKFVSIWDNTIVNVERERRKVCLKWSSEWLFQTLSHQNVLRLGKRRKRLFLFFENNWFSSKVKQNVKVKFIWCNFPFRFFKDWMIPSIKFLLLLLHFLRCFIKHKEQCPVCYYYIMLSF